MIKIFDKSRNKSKKFIDHRFKRLAQPRIIGSPIEPYLDSFIGDLTKPMSSNIIPSSSTSYNDCKQLEIFKHIFFTILRARVLTLYLFMYILSTFRIAIQSPPFSSIYCLVCLFMNCRLCFCIHFLTIVNHHHIPYTKLQYIFHFMREQNTHNLMRTRRKKIKMIKILFSVCVFRSLIARHGEVSRQRHVT